MLAKHSLLVLSFPLFLDQLSFLFNGHVLQKSHSVKHLGHILTSNLSETEDIDRVSARQIACFPLSAPSRFSQALYMAQRCGAPALRSLETTFSNILRKIWGLPRTCHTGILHCVLQLECTILLSDGQPISQKRKSLEATFSMFQCDQVLFSTKVHF